MAETNDDSYGLSTVSNAKLAEAPELDYKPRDPKSYRPAIGLIGCGGITESHLTAYQHAGYQVVALCDKDETQARKRQEQFYPQAKIYTDHRELLGRDDIEVVDIATHPAPRVRLIEDALRARKHVLSQKPFVLDLDTGERLADLAEQQNVKLAINQNGRWAPHFSYIRQAVHTGVLGELKSAQFSVNWDHSWTVGTPFEDIHFLVFYDFGIHWFDMVAHLLGAKTPRQVFASVAHGVGQRARCPMLSQALIEFDGGQASLIFNGDVQFGQQDRTYVTGTKGTIISVGPSLSEQSVTVYTAEGYASPQLEGNWFPAGFHGTMAELLCAIEENREPANVARENLKSLALAFAAIASATDGVPKVPGQVRQLPNSK